MPIRLNLLAEAQAAEEMRRKDPVKRSLWLAALVISLVLVWSSSLQLKAMVANRELSRIQGQMGAYTNEYQQVLTYLGKQGDFKDNVLKVNIPRNDLNVTVDGAVTAFSFEVLVTLKDGLADPQGKAVESALPALGWSNVGHVRVGKHIRLQVDANDASSNPGDQVNKLQEALTANPYVGQLLGKSNMISLKHVSPRQLFPTPGSTVNKESVLFTLEARLPEKTR